MRNLLLLLVACSSAAFSQCQPGYSFKEVLPGTWKCVSNTQIGGTSSQTSVDTNIYTSAVTNQSIRVIGATFGDFSPGADLVVDGRIACTSQIFFSGVIRAVSITATPAGSATVDIRTATFANFQLNGPPITTSITSFDMPSFSNSYGYFDMSLTGWNKFVTSGTVYCFYLVSASTITAANISLSIVAN